MNPNAVRFWLTLASFCALTFFHALAPVFCQQEAERSAAPEAPPAELIQAVMCREIKEFTPQDPSIVFSIELGKIACFTLFDPVRKTTHVYHTWFRQDRQVTRKRLTVKTPRWSTFSSIQLREADRGPWRVEIEDENRRLLAVLRFSITD